MRSSETWRAWALACCIVVMGGATLAAASGCRDDASKSALDGPNTMPGTVQGPPARAWEAPRAGENLVDLSALDASLRREITLAPAERFAPCHEIFEPAGAPTAPFPLTDDARRPLALVGCEPEAYQVLDDATRLLAYAVPTGAPPAADLRLVAYAADGALKWHARLDRSENARNFRANFRESFIVALEERLVCFGTLWQGGTQMSCQNAQTGEAAWTGMMPFWAGVAPRGDQMSLVSADLNGLTRRYPYSGVEMRSRAFGNFGGRTSFYASSGAHVFFSSASAQSTALTAYRIDDFEPAWRLALPGHPTPHWQAVFDDLNLLLLKIDQTLFAVDTDAGQALWGVGVGDDEPPLVARGGRLYLLVRRDAEPNLLVELDPRSGKVQWAAETPLGTLKLRVVEDTLMLQSVRAVQQVLLDAPGGTTSARPTP